MFIPFWGLGKALAFVAALNTLLALWAWTLQSSEPEVPAKPGTPERELPPDRAARLLALAVALACGFLVLFQEIVWTHMVGRFLDSTVYGFAITLFAVIAGLGLGAALVARHRTKLPATAQLPWACLGAGLLTLLLVPFWDSARNLALNYSLLSIYISIAVVGAAGIALAPQPKTLAYVFGAFPAVIIGLLVYRWWNPDSAAFWIHQGVVLCVSALFTLGAAILMGMVFPLALDWYLDAAGGAARTVAPVYAVNTLGSLAGIVVATFLVLPRTGVEWGGRAVGMGFLALGLLLLALRGSARWLPALGVVPALAWILLLPPWDLSRNHAVLGHAGKLIFAREDLNGGVTTVLENGNYKDLYSNGLFQGGDGYIAGDQARCALLPLLHARELDRAMVIGVGSGQTAGVLGLFPFKHLEVVDYSPGMIEAAQKFFPKNHLGIFNDPRVKVAIADGRHYLLTHPDKLSLLTLEVSRLWVAGEGDLYTREFYELCSARLTDRGVLQQWVPLFSLSVEDALMILRTVRAVFPHVAMYLGIESGMIVASRSPLEINFARLKAMESTPQMDMVLNRIGLPGSFSLLGDCVLGPRALDALLASHPDHRVSTDLWPHLEYSTARYSIRNPTTREMRKFFLSAGEFETMPVTGADEAARAEIQKWAREERDRQLQGFFVPPEGGRGR